MENFSVKILNRVKSRPFNENGDKGKLYRSYDFFEDETRIEACGMMMKVCKTPLEFMNDLVYLENLWLQSIA